MSKIRMDSKQDLLFLMQHFKKAALLALEGQTEMLQTLASLRKCSFEIVQKEAIARVEKRILHVFYLAGYSIEINGVEQHLAFQNVAEFEPIDESMRVIVMQQQREIDSKLVQVSKLRKEAPEMVHSLVRDSMNVLSESNRLISIPDAVDREDHCEKSVSFLPTVDEYSKTMEMEAHLIDELPRILDQAKGTEKLLDVLKIPQTHNPAPLNLKRRRSSMLSQAFNGKIMSPGKARQGLLGRLENELRLGAGL